MNKLPQPVQPLYWHIPNDLIDDHGPHLRFQQNTAVRMLVDHGQNTGLDLQKIAGFVEIGAISQDDYDQLIQLMGYSYDGVCEMSRFKEATLKRAMDAFVALGGDPDNPPKKEEHGT